jgi:two-component system, cell cycle response regulator
LRRGAQDFLLEPVREGEVLARVQSAGRTKILQEELVDQTQRLEVQLFADPLTRLYNRRFLFGQLAGLTSGARRHGRPLAIAMADLDAFKAVNDRYGHATGDEVLVAAADALQRALRAEDVLGRLGGEEFLVLLPDTDAEAAAQAAERMRSAVAGAGGPVAVTASVGWAVLADGEEPDDLVRRADTALYAAKAAGRDCVRGPATLPRRT